jgi:hypothetical protein
LLDCPQRNLNRFWIPLLDEPGMEIAPVFLVLIKRHDGQQGIDRSPAPAIMETK